MEEGFRFINEDHPRITSNNLCDYSGEGFNSIARLINQQGLGVKFDSLFVDAALFHIPSRWLI